MRILRVTGTAYVVSVCFLVSATRAGEPSDGEQLWLQLVNRFRADPTGELDRLVNYDQADGEAWGSPISDSSEIALALDFFNVNPAELRRQFRALQPAPPLAWSDNLHDSAQYYSGVLIANDQQSHRLDQYTGPQFLFDRLRQEGGYQITGGGSAGENLFAFTDDVLSGHAGFVLDWGPTPTGIQNPPGHRDNLANPVFREIGIAVTEEDDPSTQVGPLVATQHLAVDFADGPFLTGVVYQDVDTNDFYSIGEGLGPLRVELRKAGENNAVATTTTANSGGYRIDISDLAHDTYRIVLGDAQPVYWSRPFGISDTEVNLARDIRNPQFDIDSLSLALRLNREWSGHDLNGDGTVTQADRTFLIRDVLQTYFGDSNLDGEFNSGDLVAVFQAGEYEDAVDLNSLWSSGDWDGDGDFTSGDLIVAFQEGSYDTGPRVASPLPEPSSLALISLAPLAGGLARNRRRRRQLTT